MVAWMLVWLAGCEPVPPSSLDDVQFDGPLDAQRDVRLDAIGVGPVDGWRVTVRDPAGDLLFDGAAAHALRWGVNLRLPPDVDALDVTLRDPFGQTTEQRVALVDGTAAFEVGR